ncbi:MAG: HNH endonuclease [Deltaproteobacteria bacterium]|nr:HNH endonuclease [Deltaproteobacteria bacterium]
MGKVEVVEEYDHDIRSVSLVIKAPAVVRLLSYVQRHKQKPSLSRANIFARDNFECQYCGDTLNAASATVDHVLPRSRGGQTTWENIVTCCSACNRDKGQKTPKEAKMPLRKVPIQPDWLPVLQFKLNGQIPNSWHTFLFTE